MLDRIASQRVVGALAPLVLIALGVLAPGAPAWAQDGAFYAVAQAEPGEEPLRPSEATPEPPPTPRASGLEEIVVTGSRIGRSNLDGAGPLDIVGAEQISLTGVTEAEDLLRDLPSVGFQGINKNNNNGGGGLSLIDLRNLGATRTLVLVNGRRQPGGGAVDLNNVPLSLVDRIEVLRDGASAVYGADAVAGVINFVLKEDFDGLELDVLTGISEEGDGREGQLSLTGGRRFGRAQLMFNATFLDRNKIDQQDRSFARNPITGIAGNSLVLGSSLVPEGRVNGDGQFFRPDAESGQSFQPFTSLGLDQRFNFATDSFLVPPVNRNTYTLLGSYDLSDTMRAYFRAGYTTRDGRQSLAPTPLGASTTINNPLGFAVPFDQFPDDYQEAVRSGAIQVPGIDPAMIDASTKLPVLRRITEAGRRIFQQDVDASRFTVGLEGEFGTRLGAWSWEAFFNGGRVETTSETENSINLTRANQAADPAACAQDPACVPANFIGRGTLTSDQVRFFKFTERDRDVSRLMNLGFSSAGPIFELPAGTVELAVGAEWREESGFFRPDPIKRAGDSANNQVTPTRGDFNVREAFWELEVPLLAGKRFAEELTVNLAGRLTDFNTFGSDYQYRYSLSYAPSPELRLRAVASTSFRAPGIGALFGGASDSFLVLDDPCSRLDADPTGTLAANCAASGVPAGFEQRDSQIRTTVGGNPDLEAEESDFLGLGVVWTPSFLPALSVTADYFDIDIDNAISNQDPQFTLDSCFNGPVGLTSEACARVERMGVGGEITRLTAGLGNIGKTETNGIDFELRYAGPRLPLLGEVEVRGTGTYLFDLVQTLPGGKRKINGNVSPTDNGVPNFKAILDTSFSPRDDLLISTNARYIGRGDTDDATGPFDDVADVWYLDVSLRYDVNERWSVTLGVQNATDKQPPRIVDMANSNPNTYDYVGRFGFARFNASFY